MSRPSTVYAVGTIHETKTDGDFVIMEYVNPTQRVIRFLDTGFTTTVMISSIRTGAIKDPHLPSVYGVGFLGHDPELEQHPLRKDLYRRWNRMLERVYVRNYPRTISPEWLNFSTFMRDTLTLKGNELLLTHSKERPIDLDSDIIAKEKGIPPMYSKETCQWVTRVENVRSRNRPSKYKHWPVGTVIETNNGPVTIIEKDGNKWLIRFSDGCQKWCWGVDIQRGNAYKSSTVGRPRNKSAQDNHQ